MKKIFSLFAAVLFAGSMMAEATVVKSTFTNQTQAAGNAVTDLEGVVTWSIATEVGAGEPEISNGKYSGIEALKFGKSGSQYFSKVQLSTEYFKNYNVTSVKLYVLNNGKKTGTFTVKQGDVTIGSDSKEFGTAWTELTVGATKGAGGTLTLTYEVAQASYWSYIEVTYESGSNPPTPTMNYYVTGSMTSWAPNASYMLTPDNGGLYKGEFTFAANDEFKVTYSDGNTIDDANWFPSGMNNNYKITEAGDYTVTFNPAGNVEGWYEGYFQVLKKEVPVLPVYTCAQVQANQATETGELNEVQVLFVNGGQFYVRDASGMTLIYKSNHGLAIGNLVSGIVGTSTLYSNVTPQFQPSNAAADWTITQGAAPVYDEKAVAPVTTDINGVYNFINVVFAEDVEFTTASKGSAVTATIGEENISIFNNYKKAYSFEANKAYDVVGVVTVYQNNPQVYFVSAAKHTATAIDNAAIETKAIKRIENGKLVIIKNGVRYSATGARL